MLRQYPSAVTGMIQMLSVMSGTKQVFSLILLAISITTHLRASVWLIMHGEVLSKGLALLSHGAFAKIPEHRLYWKIFV